MQVEVGASLAGKRAGRSVMVRMDMGDHEPADSLSAYLGYSSVDCAYRLVGVHAAVEQVDLVAIREQEDVDKAILERDGQAELEHSIRHFAQRELNHVPGIV